MKVQLGRRYGSAGLIVSMAATLLLLQGCMKPANGSEFTCYKWPMKFSANCASVVDM